MTSRRRLPAILLFALFAALPAGFCQHATLADGLKAAVLRTDGARLHTMATGRFDALADLLTDDCLYTHSNGQAQTKTEFLAALASGALRYDSLRYEQPPRVRLFGGETAVVTGTMWVEAESKAAGKVSLHLVVTSVYVAQHGQWRLASYHSCAAPK